MEGTGKRGYGLPIAMTAHKTRTLANSKADDISYTTRAVAIGGGEDPPGARDSDNMLS